MADQDCRAASADCPCAGKPSQCVPASDGGATKRPSFSGDTGVTPTTGSPATPRDSADSGGDASTGGRRGPPSDAGTVEALDAAGPDVGSQAADAAQARVDASMGNSPSSGSTGFVGKHGPLRVEGNRVVDSQGQAIQLRGMSLFWSQWSDFYVAKNVDVLADEWKGTLVRAALGVENDGGYLQTQQANADKVRAVVERAIERGIYVIIDWHDHHAQDHAAQAKAFFEGMAKAYGQKPNVIFEIYNEPVDVSWSVVKAYAEPMIAAIRAAGSKNLIVVGTPNWSQDVDIAASSRITSDQNVAYTLHFYADTHKQSLRDKAKLALDRGIALFVTEWGTCSADGNGSVNQAETEAWLSFLQTQSISWANWALNNKAESCSAIVPSGASVGPWRDDQLTPSGLLVKSAMP